MSNIDTLANAFSFENNLVIEVDLPDDHAHGSPRGAFMDAMTEFGIGQGRMANIVLLSQKTLEDIMEYQEFKDEIRHTPEYGDPTPTRLYGLRVVRIPPLTGAWIAYVNP